MATRLELEEIASGHDFLGKAHDRNARRTVWVVVLTSVMMVAEIVAGYLTGSMALLADGYHMATHAGALGIAALAYRFARRHVANPKYSFGTGKVGDLAGFASAIILGIVGLGIGARSAIRLVHPVSIVYEEATFVAVIGLAVNIASAVLLMGGPADHAHDHGDTHAHGHAHDNNLRAAYFHVLADAVTSVLAIVALVAGWKLGWAWLDPVIGVLGGLLIARWSWGLIRDTSAMLLDEADANLMDEVRAALGELAPGVRDLHVWRIGPQAHGAIVSLCCNADAEEVRRRLAAVDEIAHLTVEVRPPIG